MNMMLLIMVKKILKKFSIPNNMMNEIKFAKDIKRSNKNIEFAPGIKIKMGLIHEIYGPSNFIMAMMIASNTNGLIIWIHEGSKIPFPDGINSWLAPNRVIIIKVINLRELLWSIEESLRVGLDFLIIGDTETIPIFSSMRRLKLIIKKYHILSKQSLPTVLILTKNSCELLGIESRWHCSPMRDLNISEKNKIDSKWKLTCQYSKHEMEKTWIITELEDIVDPFSFFKKRKTITLASKKILPEDI